MKTIKNIFWGSTMLLFTACNFLDTTPSDFIFIKMTRRHLWDLQEFTIL